jgi:hypothetical protein
MAICDHLPGVARNATDTNPFLPDAVNGLDRLISIQRFEQLIVGLVDARCLRQEACAR